MVLLSKIFNITRHKVYGCVRRTSSPNLWRIDELELRESKDFELLDMDILDQGSVIRTLSLYKPREIYNLAAQSFVGVLWRSQWQPLITGLAVTNLLEAIRIVDPQIKFYQASTSEMFGKVQSVPQSEATDFYP